MKTLIKTSALLFVFGLFSTGVFAATKAVADTTEQDEISITALSNDCAVSVSIDKATPSTSLVTIFDNSDSIILREGLSKADGVEKGYDFRGLDDGDYIIEVTSNNTVVEKTVHVYTDGNEQKLEVSE